MTGDSIGPLGCGAGVDFAAIFAAQPTAYLVMTPDLVIVEANQAYLELLGRTRDELIGRQVFDAFPPSPESLDEAGDNPLELSFVRARDTGRPDQMPLFRYAVLDHETGQQAQRAWSLISFPVLDHAGRTQLILQRVEDASDYLAERERQANLSRRDDWDRLDGLEADLFARTQELRAAVEAQQSATERLAAMARVAIQLAAAETVQDLTTILTGAGLAALGADGGAIGIRDDDTGTVHVTHTETLGDRAQQRFGVLPLTSRMPAAWVAQSGSPLLLGDRAAGLAWTSDMAAAYEETGQLAWIGVPLRAGDRLLGSLVASWTEERTFPPAELQLVEAFAVQCAQALDRLQALTRERRAAERSRRLSETLQRSMLTEPFQPDHCQIVVRYLPAADAAQVGGDWYDAFLQADGALNLVIGDVVGHDTNSAAMMGQLRSLLRGITVSGAPGPAHVLDALDTAVTQLCLDTYATVGIARLEQDADAIGRRLTWLRWASAGHLPPVIIDADGQLVPVPEVPGRMMLGVDHTTRRGETVIPLEIGATVLLYTDGLVERPGSDLDTGVGRLLDLATELSARPLDEVCDQLLDRLVQGRPTDDVALVAVRLHRPDQPRPAEAGPNRVPANIGQPPTRHQPIR